MNKFQLRKLKQKNEKFPLKVSEKKLLKEQKTYMRLRDDSEYELLQHDHVIDSLKNINDFTEKDTVL